MLTRSTFLAGLAASAAVAGRPAQAQTAMAPSTSTMDVPRGACDCHVHVFDPAFPFDPKRSYTPGRASLEDLRAFEKRLGIDRIVLVQPSPYGSDNSAMLDALGRLGPTVARGVAVIDPARVTDAELDAMQAAGVRSVRINMESHGNRQAGAAESALAAVTARLKGRPWSVQVFAALPVVASLKDELASLPLTLVADHFAGARAEAGTGQPGFRDLLDMLATGKLYVKLSAPYRASRDPAYADVAAIAKAMIEAAPDRMLWASDWPHTGGGSTGSNERRTRSLDEIEPFRTIDVRSVLDLLEVWAPDPATRRRILVDNPARLYGF